MIAHELIKSPGRRIFSEDGECLAESYVRCDAFRRADCEDMLVDGGGIREMVFVKHVTKSGSRFYFADRSTGSLYDPDSGRCKSSSNLRLSVPV